MVALFLCTAWQAPVFCQADWSSFESELNAAGRNHEGGSDGTKLPFTPEVTDPYKEIDETFHRRFKLGLGPTPQSLTQVLEPRGIVLKSKLKSEFYRYGTLAMQYASYGHPGQAMEVYKWIEQNWQSILDPDDSFFKRISAYIGLYLYVQADYTNAITCLHNALKEPIFTNTPRQKLAMSMACFGLAESYNKLGDAKQAEHYLAQARRLGAPDTPPVRTPPPKPVHVEPRPGF